MSKGPLVDDIPRTRLSPHSIVAEYIRIGDVARTFARAGLVPEGRGHGGHDEALGELARLLDGRPSRAKARGHHR